MRTYWEKTLAECLRGTPALKVCPDNRDLDEFASLSCEWQTVLKSVGLRLTCVKEGSLYLSKWTNNKIFKAFSVISDSNSDEADKLRKEFDLLLSGSEELYLLETFNETGSKD